MKKWKLSLCFPWLIKIGLISFLILWGVRFKSYIELFGDTVIGDPVSDTKSASLPFFSICTLIYSTLSRTIVLPESVLQVELVHVRCSFSAFFSSWLSFLNNFCLSFFGKLPSFLRCCVFFNLPLFFYWMSNFAFNNSAEVAECRVFFFSVPFFNFCFVVPLFTLVFRIYFSLCVLWYVSCLIRSLIIFALIAFSFIFSSRIFASVLEVSNLEPEFRWWDLLEFTLYFHF